MKIHLYGNGKMGQMISKVATTRSHAIVPNFEAADVCVDFSHPDVAIDNLIRAAKQQKSVVMGTTGWYDRMEEVRSIVNQSKVGFLWSANFSLGVQLFVKIVERAAQLIAKQKQYDVSLIETHHRQKVDSPSGTAKVLGEILLDQFHQKSHLITTLNGPIAEDAIHVSSVRSGVNPGNHTVVFDSPVDTITLSHQSHTREGFALGAVVAAEWLKGKQGFYTIDDMIKELL